MDLDVLARADLLGARAAAVGFDWASAAEVLPKLREEVDELEAAMAAGEQADVQEELGDLLFTISNLARHLDVPVTRCLRQANDKFERRFRALEAAAHTRGERLGGLAAHELEARWQQVKAVLKGS